MPESERLLYSTAEAGAKIHVGRTKLFELMASGELASVQIGSARLIAAADLDDFVARRRRASANDERVRALLAAVDAEGRLDVTSIPPGTTLADLDAAKRLVADREATDAA